MPDRVSNSYKESIDLATVLSEYYNIPQYIYQEGNEIKIDFNNENNYKIESVKIQPIDRKENMLLYLFIGFVLVLIISAFLH